MRNCYQHDLGKLLGQCEEFQKMGRENQKNFLQYALSMSRKVILLGADPGFPLQVHPEEQEFVERFARLMNPANREGIAVELEQSQYHIERNANPKIEFFHASLRLAALLRLKPVAA